MFVTNNLCIDIDLSALQQQHNVSIFFTRLWSIRISPISDTQKSAIPGFSASKNGANIEKMTFLLASHQTTFVAKNKAVRTDRIKKLKKNRNIETIHRHKAINMMSDLLSL